MALTKKEITDLYRKRARRYDFTANLYYLFGFREQAYRRMAVDALGLKTGDTVVEIGCGTGLNFSLLRKAVGEQGKIVGVDLTDAMLDQAKRRVAANGWTNVELVSSDAAQYRFPQGIDGVTSMFALTLSPEYDTVVRNGCEALKPGKRWAVLDFKMPSGLMAKLLPLFLLVTRPFGVTLDLAGRHPWESVGRYMDNVMMTERYGGIVYLATGQRRAAGC